MKKILSTFVMCLILGVGNVWAEQVQVSLYDGTNRDHELITQTVGGTNYQALNALDLTLVQLNQSDKAGTAWIQFSSPNYTIISSYSFGAIKNNNSPTYSVNDGTPVTPTSTNQQNPDIVSGTNADNTLKVATTTHQTKFMSWVTGTYYCRLKNFQLKVVIPEVVPTTTTMTTLTKLTNSDLDGNRITRTGYVPFVVKDPIDQTNPQNYFSATISAGATGESWTVLESEWSCEANAGSFIVRVPVQYTATNKQKGTFSATVHLESKNTYNTANDDQNAQITVGDVKQEYAISWGNSWVDGSEVDLFKGDIYPRTGNGGYLANTAGLTLGTPVVTEVLENPTGASTLVSFAANGAMTLHETGKVRLTYTQPGSTTHNEKRLTLTVNIIKRTPAFTLKSDEYVDGVHIFYVNHEYIPFVESSNEDFVTYPIEVTNNNSDNDQFISFVAENAITHAVPKEDIQITVHQEAGDLWNESSATYTIAIRENPIHVGTLCRRTITELFNDANFTIEKRYSARLDATGTKITIGTTAGGSNGGYVIFHFTGTPDALEWTEGVNYETTNGNNVTWTVEQSATNEEGSYTSLGAGNTFNEDAQYLKITISGTQSQGNITSLCITEKVGASITPDPIELVVLDDGNGGKLVMDASFTANVSNLTELTLQLNSDDFILLRDGKTYNEADNTLLLDYTDGLGIDKNASAVVQVHYVGDRTTALGKTCIVTALDENDVVQSTATIKVIELPAGDIPAVIIPGIADRTGIFTGTEMFIDGHATYSKYPYRKKEEVNLSAAFKGGVAAFDQLFIFGLTTNDNDLTVTVNGVTAPQINKPSATANSNAVTPCFIYTKSGNNYALSSIIPNVNIATKPTEFNITDMSKSYYFTGYAPYASCGSTWEENAVFLFTSKGNAVNLYLDNLELYARPKAATGNKVPVKQYTVNGIGEAIGLFGDPDMNVTTEPELALEVFVQGSGAAFAFASTSSTEFKPTIHLRGTNILESTAGASVRVTSSLLSMDATASQQSSPIQVLLKKDGGKNSKTNLTITDTWADGTTRTNGILDLANLDVRPAPTIDLGNANTTLNINGGQYFLSNAANTSISYTVSYAISYRKKSMAGDKAQMFGLGDDQPEGKVRFKDGSINCSVLPKAYFNESLYHNQTSMKCPQDTKIDGGTFNCDVLSCTSTTSKGGSPTNTAGQALCMVEIPIEGVDNTNGTAILKTDWMDYALANGANTDQLDYYGIKSMTPTITNDANGDDIQVVNLMLPSDKICFMDMVRIPWVLCTPDVTVKQTGVTETLGGNKEVESSIAEGDEGITNVKLTARLLYAELDDYTKYAIADYTVPGGYEVTIANKNHSYVTNANSYLISDKIYWVRPVVANQWQMIVPPFDVANIYIVESYPEEQLLKDFGTRTTNKIGQEVYVIDDENKIYDARIAQAKSMMDLVYYWMYDADPAGFGNDNDLWPKKGWDMSKFVREWVDYEVSKNGDNKAYQPIIEQLYHFTGNNWEANYYLYKSSGEWVDEGDKFVTDWQLVQEQSVKRGSGTPQTIMRKGGIYAMSFPYSIYNDGSHDPGMTWDYWTGKYIIMEGYPTETNKIVGDVQVLSGTDTDWNGKSLTSTVLADFTTEGKASLRGNSTFGELTVQNQNALILPTGGNTFRPDPDANHTLAPGEGFMLANAPATPSPMPRRIASIDMMTGDVTYEPGDSSENTVTGTPTIAGEREMLVYTVAGGLGVVPVVPQHVSIYNAAGQLVVSQYLTDNTQFALPTGIYLVRGEKDQAKAMVK